MTQTLPASLVAPTQSSLSADAVGYLIRTIAGVEGSFVSNTGTAGAISKVASTGYFYATTGITAPDDGGVLEWYISNAGVKSTFLSAVAIEPVPNQADQAAGIRAALGLASANMDTQLSAINSKTTNLPAAPAAVGDIPTTTQIWTHATRALTDKDNFNLASSQSFSTTGSVGSVTGAVGSVTNPVTAGTVSDKTGYSLSSSQTFNLTGNITGNLSGSVGSVTGAVGSVTGAVGSVTAPVTVGTINNNVITGNAVDTTAVNKIQANLATQASVDTKASQTSVDAIPTTPLLAANYTAPDNASIAAIKAKTDNLPSDPADQSELATLISAIPTVAPDNAGIAAIKAKTDNLPSDPADQSELVTLINTRLAAADYVAPDNTGILTAIGALPSASTITNSVWNATLSNYTGPGSTGAKLNLASTLTVGDIPAGLTAQQVWEYATRTLSTASGLTTEQNTKLNELWRKAQLDNANPVTRDRNLSTGTVTETLGQTGIQIVHAETNDGNTVTSTRQP